MLLVPMCIVVTYTIVRHAGHEGKGGPLGHEAVFKDHTSYGAVLAMLLPPGHRMAEAQDLLARVLGGLGWCG